MPEHLSDAILLERFVTFREEAAFGALVERHGPLVQRICRRVLRNEHDVEDVFQATFLVLARRASGIPWRESVAGWLGAVAHRLALGARSDLNRQYRREATITAVAHGRYAGEATRETRLREEFHRPADPVAEFEQKEAGRLVNDELLRLPEKYRSPVVLCYLEGRTHEEAARELGWPAGSMSRRLKRAQAILRRRLIHRGLTLGALLFVSALAVVAAWIMWSDRGRDAAAVRSAMAAFAPLSDRDRGIQIAVASIDRKESDGQRELMMTLARRATRVANEIETYDPRKRPAQWRQYLSEMKLSAAQLLQATSENDRSSMVTAVRRLNASCLGCHKAFCQSDRESARGEDSSLPRAEIPRKRASTRSVSWFIFEETSTPAAPARDSQTRGTMEVALLTALR